MIPTTPVAAFSLGASNSTNAGVTVAIFSLLTAAVLSAQIIPPLVRRFFGGVGNGAKIGFVLLMGDILFSWCWLAGMLIVNVASPLRGVAFPAYDVGQVITLDSYLCISIIVPIFVLGCLITVLEAWVRKKRAQHGTGSRG